MKVTVKMGLLFAAIWIASKMIFFITGITEKEIIPSVLLNILFMLMAISFGLYFHKRKEIKNHFDAKTIDNLDVSDVLLEESSMLSDIKNGLKSGVPYAIIVSLFLFFYYDTIDPDFNQHQISEAEMGIQKLLDNPAELDKIRAENEDFEVMTKDEIYNSMVQGPQIFYNAKSTAIVSMLALLMLATLNSIFVTIIYRKVVFK